MVPSSQTILLGQSATLTATGGTSYTWSNGQTGPSITVSPTSTTILSVTGVTGTCSVTGTGLITVNTPTTVCITNTCPDVNGTYVETIPPFPGIARYFTNLATSTVLALYSVQGWFLYNDNPRVVYYSNPSTNRTIPTTGWTASGACMGPPTFTEGTCSAPDLSPTLSLPQANFAVGITNNFLVSLFEVNGLPTSLGNVTITITAPVGYTLSFNSSLTSINVTGALAADNPAPVRNTNWTVVNTVENSQITLPLKPDQSIAARATMNLRFSLTRTTANTGSVASITVNIADDPTRSYDGNLNNNVYARVISGL